MATPNGDVKVETAESFARDYLEDLFNNNKNLGAFEEETLDLNIKSKYDDVVVEEEVEAEAPLEPGHDSFQVSESVDSNSATFTVTEAAPVQLQEEQEEEESVEAEAPLEPGQETFQVNGHAEVEVTQTNGHLEDDVPEPNQSEFTSQPEVVEHVTSIRLEEEQEPPVAYSQFESQQESIPEPAEVAPTPTARGKAVEEDEDELGDMQFQKLGLTKNWWASKRNESEGQKEQAPTIDKFRTIKQNIKRGNTRSLMSRFENMSKLTE